MKIETYNTASCKTDSWIYYIIPTIEVSNLVFDGNKYSIAFMWLNFNIEIRI